MRTILPTRNHWSATITWLTLMMMCAGSLQAQVPTVTTGKSYINITRPNGGTFLPGDVIEIRATIAVSGGSNTAANRLNSVRYNDTINLSKCSYIPNSLRMISNEGRTQFLYTDGADADSAHIDVPSGRLRFNIGNSAASADVNTQTDNITNAGRLWGSSSMRPSFYGNTCIRVYAYQVQIRNSPLVALDTLITLAAGNFRYRSGSAVTDALSNFPRYELRVSPDYGLCDNALGGNAILGEFGGTFGSGLFQNRAGGSSFVPPPYSFLNFAANAPNDNFYGLANRTSADGSTNPNSAFPGATRVFNIWDIIGDHTGAANTAAGNLPSSLGYAVIINASYETNRAFTQNITGLCEETFYEFSAWFRNICRRCSCDSTGKGAGNTGFVPGPGNDSSGVRPNLTFQIDGQDYYTTGNIAYTGTWVKKGFIFRTRPGQTSFTVTIRNNAPGGGGNDWAIDDIGVKTCLPSMQYSPSITPTVCQGNALTIQDTVRSFFPNYVFHKWQKSTDAGANWFDFSLPIGPVTNLWNGLNWQYISTINIPPAMTLPANAGDKYRLLTATSLLNLLNVTCRSTDATNSVTLNVMNCGPVLGTRLLNFNGRLSAARAILQWTATGSEPGDRFDVERSTDGVSFARISTVSADERSNGPGDAAQSSTAYYHLPDPQSLTGKTWYRLKVYAATGSTSYSRIIEMTPDQLGFAFVSVINPFSSRLSFDLRSDKRATVQAELLDGSGRPIRQLTTLIQAGNTQLAFDQVSSLPAGLYVLRVEQDGVVLVRKVMKQ